MAIFLFSYSLVLVVSGIACLQTVVVKENGQVIQVEDRFIDPEAKHFEHLLRDDFYGQVRASFIRNSRFHFLPQLMDDERFNVLLESCLFFFF